MRLDHRTLVRFWGQRNTLHLYAAGDWPFLYTVREQGHWPIHNYDGSLLERGLEQAGLLADFRRLVTRTRRRLAEDKVLTHKEIHSKKLEEGHDRYVVSVATLMQLVREGVACHGAEQDGESGFVHREHWLPGLDGSPPPADEVEGRTLCCTAKDLDSDGHNRVSLFAARQDTRNSLRS